MPNFCFSSLLGLYPLCQITVLTEVGSIDVLALYMHSGWLEWTDGGSNMIHW